MNDENAYQYVFGPVPSRRLGSSLGVDVVPFKTYTFDNMVQGVCPLNREFSGLIWLEVFIVNNITTRGEQLVKRKDLIDRISPDRIQLNTAIRGAGEDFDEAVSMEEMEEIREFMGHDEEIIAHGSKSYEESCHEIKPEDILNLLKRRPCTIDDLSFGLHIHRNEAIKHETALKAGYHNNERIERKRTLYGAGYL